MPEIHRVHFSVFARGRFSCLAFWGALALALICAASAQEPTPAPPPAQPGTATPLAQPDAPTPPAATTQQAPAAQAPEASPAKAAGQESAGAPAQEATKAAEPEKPQPGSITEEELKQMLVGKALFLRGGYLDNSLSFNEHGGLIGHSPQGSYTLNAVQIEKIRLTKHKSNWKGRATGCTSWAHCRMRTPPRPWIG